ncbi:MAG TPA: glycosyltransferase [Solirubrobacteraceae bacterium]|nr:glycosyltransferase [Solirubrobacteraceae bacterium]
MTARVLFTCWPFDAHVFPQMSIATALRDRGVEVAFYSGEEARPAIEREGLEFFAFERVKPESWLRVQAAERQAGTREQSARVGRQAVRDWLVETIPDQLADLESVLDRWAPDVIATDLSMWGPIVVLWESCGVPVAASSTFMGPLIPGPDAPPWGLGLAPPRSPAGRARARTLTTLTDLLARGLRARVDELRAAHGLRPLGCSVNEFTGRLPLYLVGNLPELDYDRRDLPASVHYVGPCTWHPPADTATEAWLDAIPIDAPWVHATESTLRHGDPFVLRAAAEGLAGTPVRAILTTGNHRAPDELGLGHVAPNVHLARWVNHDELLPRCAAVVTTGGAATIISSLQAGVPLVVVPTTWDKPDNARRVVEAGAGIRLKPNDCTPGGLRAAVQALLTERRYRDRARAIAARLAAAPGPARAAELLQSLAPVAPAVAASSSEHPQSSHLQGSRQR